MVVAVATIVMWGRRPTGLWARVFVFGIGAVFFVSAIDALRSGRAELRWGISINVLMNKRRVSDYSTNGPVTQKGIRACRDFEVRDGATPILGFHDHPDGMWIAAAYSDLADHCSREGWLKIEGVFRTSIMAPMADSKHKRLLERIMWLSRLKTLLQLGAVVLICVGVMFVLSGHKAPGPKTTILDRIMSFGTYRQPAVILIGAGAIVLAASWFIREDLYEDP